MKGEAEQTLLIVEGPDKRMDVENQRVDVGDYSFGVEIYSAGLEEN